MSQQGAAWVIFALAFVGSLGPFSIDAYLPALPPMTTDLGASAAQLQWTISAYLIGVAVFPLFLSPLSDAIGRRPVMAGGLIAYIVVSTACALAPSIEALLALRVLQAAAGGTVMVTARAVLADLYRGDALSRAMSYLMMIFTLAPVVAPLAGAWLLELGGWRWIFFALSGFAVAALCIVAALPETLRPAARRPFRPGDALSGYGAIIRPRASLRFLLATFWSAFIFFAMLGGAPFIFIDHYGMSPGGFGLLFALISSTSFAANILNARLVMRVGYLAMLRGVSVFFAAMAAAMVLVAATGAGGLWGVFAVMLGLMGGFQIAVANTTAGIMTVAEGRAGAASAVLALWRFVGGALGAGIGGLIGAADPASFAIVTALGALGLLAALLLDPPRR